MTKEKTKQKLSLQQLVSSHVTNMHLTDMYVSWEMCYIPAVNSSEVKNMLIWDTTDWITVQKKNDATYRLLCSYFIIRKCVGLFVQIMHVQTSLTHIAHFDFLSS